MSECKYCKQESYGRPFCPDCGKKYFGIEFTKSNETTNQTIQNIQVEKEIVNKKEIPITHRMCIHCNKNAIPGSSLCETHYKEEYNKRQQTYYTLTELKKYKKNNLNLANVYNQNSKYDLSSKNDNYHNKKYTCKNGIITRSKSERTISDFLTDNNIEHYYEKSLHFTVYDENMNSNNITLKPDFYIPELKYNGIIYKNIFIEHWGKENDPDYNLKKEVKLSIYKQAKITVICTTEDDMNNPYTSLIKKLKNIKNSTINR